MTTVPHPSSGMDLKLMYQDCTLCPECAMPTGPARPVSADVPMKSRSQSRPSFLGRAMYQRHQRQRHCIFTGCTLRCCFCQNYSVSSEGFGKEITEERLSEIFLELQDAGAHNINLVTATQYLPSVLPA